MFARLVGSANRHATTAPCGRRAYSFFSSKPGGGRYFNSAKPPNSTKVVAPAGTSGAKAESASGADAVNPPAPSSPSKPAEEGSSAEPCSSSSSSSRSPPSEQQQPVQHTPITPHDLNLHNFFSLHRPLLLLSQPSSILFETPTAVDFAAVPQQSNIQDIPPVPTGMEDPDDIPEPSAEADADAARLLARALVINRLGSSVSWDNTLQTLGLDSYDGIDVEQEALLDAYDAYMDSTKRKKRKKMKKHKLKKRRRLQRAHRIKIGK